MSEARIVIRGLAVRANHGVMPEEKRLGQLFELDLEIEADIGCAAEQDDYGQAVCYAAVSDVAVRVASESSFFLVETLAERIASAILAEFPAVTLARVTVHKPSAPIQHVFQDLAVTLERRRLVPVGFGLGGNQGDRAAMLRLAVTRLALAEGVAIERVSRLYDSAPWGVTDQPPFLNLCVVGTTSLAPRALVRLCKEIETALGREAGPRWGPRAVDIDLLFLGEQAHADPFATVPHPRLAERAFVLAPLAEIVPDQRIGGRRVADLLAALPRTEGDAVPCEGEEGRSWISL